MLKPSHKIFGLLMLLQISGCAVMSKSDCLNADWYDVGFRAAMDGEHDRVRAFTRRADTCSKYGETADLTAFETGHADGTLEYCDFNNAVKLGADGSRKALDICPEEEHPGFVASFEAGYKLHEMRRAERDAEYELRRLDSEISRNRSRIRELYSIAGDSDATDKEKATALRRIRYLRNGLYDLDRELDYWRREHYRAQRAADEYEDILELEYDNF